MDSITSRSNQPMNPPTLPSCLHLPSMPMQQANFHMDNMSHPNKPMTKTSKPLEDTNHSSKAMDYKKLDLRQSHTNMYHTNLPFHQSCPPQNYATLSENNKSQFKNLPFKPSSKNSVNAPAPRSPRTPPGFHELELKPQVEQFPAPLTTTTTSDIFPFKSHPRAADEDTDEIYSDDYENPDDFLKKLYEKYKIK